LRYSAGLMTEPEKLIFETQNPTMAKMMSTNLDVGSVIRDVSETKTVKDPATGQDVSYPAYTYSDLKEKYPTMQESDLKSLVSPVYKQAAVEDVESYLQESQGKKPEGFFGWLQKDEPINSMDVLKSIYNKEDTEKYPEGGYDSVKKTAIYREMKSSLLGDYGDIFTSAELDRILYNSIMERL
jgi:hypothetical protein